ncbi:APC membrane recruitment protein 2-like [Sphaeramia orbicularis]|uniref:APC membrane recruitment protein 2-like n=1 Tax=Sphaeramia orbicularis TaxID=375764 RepID=UPI00117EF371|nr:APC membrane recruitment protein 2-like [Sphaeramia orbicularis]
MDVQTESTDPPPGESQSSGKIRKGFKLFGKRKPGNIFSIRNKGDGNNKSPVNKAKTPDGLETAAADTEQDPEKEKGQGVNQGDGEQTDEEPLGEDGVIAAAPARTSISSASSAKSLGFLSLLRGGRRGVLDRRVQTVSQPVGRQRRGLKGLFGNVKFRSKDKEDKEEKEEAPPSPLLMSSRTNSVEIIKEDLTLTPKSQPRSLDSPGTESCGPTKSLTTQDSPATSPSETMSPQMTAGNVSRTNEHVPPLPTTEPPMVPGENSLSTLLADISSLLTFDSISGGGDIMADVEAEWGKSSGATSPAATKATASPTSLFSKPTMSSPLTSSSITTSVASKPSSVAVSMSQTQSLTSAKTTITSSPVAKPSTIITTLTKSSTLTTQTVKSGSASAPEPVTSITTKLTTTSTATTKPSSTPVTSTSVSAPIMSSLPITKPTLDAPSTTAPPNTPAAVVKAPSASPTLTSTVSKLASEITEHPKLPVAATKSCPVSSPFSAKPPLTHSPPTPATFTQSLSAKLDLTGSVNLQTFSSYKSSATGELKPQTAVSVASTVTTQPSPPAPVVSSKTTPAPTSVSTPVSVSTTVSKPIHTSSPMDLSKTPSIVTSAVCPPSSTAAPGLTKPQSGPASVPTPSAASLDKISSTVPATAPTSLGKMPPPPTTTPAPTSQTVAPPVPATAPSQTPLTQTKPTPAPVEVPVSQSKAPPASVAFTVSVNTPGPQAKPPPTPVAFSVSINDPVPVSQGKAPPAPVAFSIPKDAPVPVNQAKAPPSPAETIVSVPKAPTPAPQIPVSVPKAPTPAPQIPVSAPKAPTPAPQIPVSVPKAPTPAPQIPVSVPKDPPAPVQIPLSQSKAPTPAPVPCPVTSLSSSEASKMRDSGRGTVDGLLGSQKSSDAQETQPVPSKTDELQNESWPNKEEKKRTPQAKTTGLSKIPVVGGGRAGKIPVRDSQHADEEASRDPPTPVLEEVRPHFNSHDTGSKDKISNAEATVVTPKHTQEESLQLQQPKGSTCLQRDSKIPVKHGAQSHTASQIPQAKDPPRTKIPVSKVPVRRVGNKPTAASGSSQMRK